MSVVHAARHTRHQSGGRVGLGKLVEAIGKTASLDELHREERAAIKSAVGIDWDNIWVVERGYGFGLGEETFLCILVSANKTAEYFERDSSLHLICCEVNDAATAATDFTFDLVDASGDRTGGGLIRLDHPLHHAATTNLHSTGHSSELSAATRADIL